MGQLPEQFETTRDIVANAVNPAPGQYVGFVQSISVGLTVGL